MTARVGLIGYPLTHTLSPLLHATLYGLAGIDARYDLWEIAPEAFPTDFREQLKAEWLGLNVTTPHKERVIPYCDVLSEGAELIGAVNHLWIDPRGRVVGDNKDLDGAYFTLQGIAAANADRPSDWLKELHVLGFGPAARAVAVGYHRHWRTERARLKKHTRQDPGAATLTVYLREIRDEHRQWQERLAQAMEGEVRLLLRTNWAGAASGLVVNATTIRDVIPPGMPAGDYGIWDLNYGRPTTPLVAAAKAEGRYAIDGLPMLLWQGFFSATRWFPDKLDPRAQMGLTKPVMDRLRESLGHP